MTVEIQIEGLDIEGVISVVDDLRKEGTVTEQELGDVAIVAHPYEIRSLCEELNLLVTGPYKMSPSEIMDLMSGGSFFSLMGVIIKPIIPKMEHHEH